MLNAIINGTIVSGGKVYENLALLFDGEIKGIVNKNEIPESARVIDAEGGYVIPGMIDLHVHGGGGADFLDGDRESIETVLKTHAAHGTTSLVATTLTCKNEILFKGMSGVADYMKSGHTGSNILGLHLEGPYFASASKGAQKIVGEQRIPTKKECDEIWDCAEGKIIRWDAAVELPNMEWFADYLKEKNVLASVGHSAANAETVLKMYKKGFNHITHMYCSTTTEHKEGQTVHGGIIEAAYLEDGITVELIGDGRHIPKETMLLAFKIKGAKNIALVTDAMRAAGTDVKTSVLGPLEDGTPVIIDYDVAQLPDKSSYAGSIATMDRVFRTALGYGIPVTDVVTSVCETPARLSGVLNRKGTLDAGKDADIVVFTKDLAVKNVFIGGEEAK